MLIGSGICGQTHDSATVDDMAHFVEVSAPEPVIVYVDAAKRDAVVVALG